MENPFEPPASPFEPPLAATGHLAVGRALGEAWDATWDAFPLWLGVLFVEWVLGLAAALTLFGYILVLPVVAWGFVRFLLNLIDRRAAFQDVFAGFSRYGEALGSFLGIGAVLALSFVPALTVNLTALSLDISAFAALGWGVFFALFFGVTMRLAWAPFYAVDRGLGAQAALRHAWAATAQLKLAVIALACASAAVGAVGVLALGVGIVPSSMVASAMWPAGYRQLEPSSAPRPTGGLRDRVASGDTSGRA